MITVGRRYHYTARRGKLARKRGQTVTVLSVQHWQVRVHFPDGTVSHVEPRFLQEIKHANYSSLPLVHPAPDSHS